MRYKVTRQYSRGPETIFAEFAQIDDARQCINEQLAADAALRVLATYRITEFGDVIQEFDPTKQPVDKSQEPSGSSSGAGSERAASFRPTPLNMAPRPSSVPHHWVKEDKTDDDKK